MEKVVEYIKSLQNEDGSFSGDQWGEVDTRFSYGALLCLKIMNRLEDVDVDKAIDYVLRCRNFDGGFGCIPGAESHAGQIFCCVGALALTNSLNRTDVDLLGWWLSERQLPCGGFNGRPDKKEDVSRFPLKRLPPCYLFLILCCLPRYVIRGGCCPPWRCLAKSTG